MTEVSSRTPSEQGTAAPATGGGAQGFTREQIEALS